MQRKRNVCFCANLFWTIQVACRMRSALIPELSGFYLPVDICREFSFFVIFGENVKEKENEKFLLTPWRHGPSLWGSSLLFQRNEAYTPYTLELARVRVVNFFMPSNLLHAASSFAFHSKYHCSKKTGCTVRRYVNFHVIFEKRSLNSHIVRWKNISFPSTFFTSTIHCNVCGEIIGCMMQNL